MKPALSRGATVFAALAAAVFGRESPAAHTRVPTASKTPIGVTSTPILTREREAPNPEAGLMEPEPEPQITPGVPALVAPHPLGPGDCDGAGWRSFTIPKFKDRSACESWVREHLDPDAGPRLFLFPAPDPSLSGPNQRSSFPLRV